MCDGFCWAAETIGCGGSDCLNTCKAKTESATCGSYYRNVVECTYGRNELALHCDGGTPVPDPAASSCTSAIEQYDNCMMQQNP